MMNRQLKEKKKQLTIAIFLQGKHLKILEHDFGGAGKDFLIRGFSIFVGGIYIC
jgi:hypothetical protein